MGVCTRTGPVAQTSLSCRAARRHLERAGALDAVRRGCAPRGRGQCRRSGVPAVVHSPHRDRVASPRRALRALRGNQPRDSAQLSERSLAAAVAAALRARDLPVLSRTRRARGPPAHAHGNRCVQRALSRRRRRAMGAVAVGGVKAAELDGVTLVDPMPELLALLPGHEPRAIEHAFHAEVAYYRGSVGAGRDATTLAQLRESCVGVFNEALGSSLSVEEYVGALRFEVLPGTVEALERLRALGLTLAVVGNWDFSLHERLADAGLRRLFATVVHAAGKPDPGGILRALDLIGVSSERALHIGDGDSDEEAARAAGVRFAPA